MEKDATTKEGIDELKKRQSHTEWLMVGITAVLFLAFMGLVFALGIDMTDSYRGSESSYADLVNTITKQSYEINLLLVKDKLPITQ